MIRNTATASGGGRAAPLECRLLARWQPFSAQERWRGLL